MSGHWHYIETNANNEGSFIAHNGDTMVICNPADNNALNFRDEDDVNVGWSITSSGSLVGASDIRTKTDIKSLNSYEDVCNKFKQIRFVEYKRKRPDISGSVVRENKYNEIHYGVIAQELQLLFPDLVRKLNPKEEDSYLSVEYTKLNMVSYLVIQQQQDRIKKLEDENVYLNSVIETLLDEFAKIKVHVGLE